MSIDHVYSRIMALTQHIQYIEADAMKGAVHTLKRMIIKTTDSSEIVERRFTQTIDGNQTFGDKILDFFVKYAPNEIATLALSSNIFRESMSSKISNAITVLKSDNEL